MKAIWVSAVLLSFSSVLAGSPALDRARQLESSGDARGARAELTRAAQAAPRDATAQLEYAEFLDRYGDPGAREAYARALELVKGDAAKRAAVARRLAVLDLTAGDRAAAAKHLEAAGHGGVSARWQSPAQGVVYASVDIPGPLRSFARMAAISSDLGPDDVLPALARNVVTNGYQASHSNDALEQTEYLKLVHRYLSQARELDKLAGDTKVLTIENCESPRAGELLRILGFRMRGGCGSDVVLETVNATRAFLTTDSGFPLPELEQALRTNRPFTYDFKPTKVPVLYSADYWMAAVREKESNEFIDVFLSDPSLCRLYLGISKLDPHTSEELRKQMPVQRLRAFAHVLDFFGGMFEIREGRAIVPGSPKSDAMWTELVGASPTQGAAFFEKLLAKDDGWLASLFDALLRTRGPVQAYLTEPERMKRFYTAVKGRVTSPGPARPVFRSNADMMLLTTRLKVDANGKPHIPGNLEIWKQLFVNHPHGKYDGKLTKAAGGWKDPDDLLEALFGLSRKAVENEPLKIFMALTDIDRNRTTPLAPATVDRLAREFRTYGSQYTLFNDAPNLNDKTILQFLDDAQAITKTRDQLLRANVAGTLQALVGLFQIFSRNGTLPESQADATLSQLLTSFAAVKNDIELFDAGRAGINLLLKATGAKEKGPQVQVLALLAGANAPDDAESHAEMVQEMQRVLEAQRIISLDSLFDLADHMEALAKGERGNPQLVSRMAARVSEIQLPRASLSSVEKNALAFGYWTEKHIENQRKLNLRAAVDKADAARLRELRGALAPFLRDTLVAYNYAHYAPPGAQILYTNPVFVRSHDFLGVQGTNQTWRGTELFGTGWPSNGGGRLVGSLAGLPYALAEAEQNFLIPSQTQALIWGDLVPQMILSAKIPRFWHVTPAQLHWVGLHVRYGRNLLAEAALDVQMRPTVLDTLNRLAPPARVQLIGAMLDRGEVADAIEHTTPAEMFLLGAEMAAKPREGDLYAGAIRALAREHAAEVTPQAISRAFGTPKPTLANSYRPELLNLRTFPTLMGYSSRIMAESWESNALYFAALADELHMPPSQLNVRVPEWTQKLVERIFASHLEDWPAVLRSLRIVGDGVKDGARKQLAADRGAQLQ